MANNWQIDMIAGLDPNQSRAKINGQINKLKGQLKDISLTAKIDPKIASDIQKQLTNLQVSLTNVKISDKALNDMIEVSLQNMDEYLNTGKCKNSLIK